MRRSYLSGFLIGFILSGFHRYDDETWVSDGTGIAVDTWVKNGIAVADDATVTMGQSCASLDAQERVESSRAYAVASPFHNRGRVAGGKKPLDEIRKIITINGGVLCGTFAGAGAI